MKKKYINPELKKIIDYFGNQKNLAIALNNQKNKRNCAQQNISYWLNSPHGVPEYWIYAISKLCPNISAAKLRTPFKIPNKRNFP